MRTVLGLLNGTLIENLLVESYPTCNRITAAVAYADFREPLIDHLRRHPGVSLSFYGRLDENEAVSLKLLRWFLRDAPSTATCRMVRGKYHPKLIWWHGFGAYIGSGNLTKNGWQANIECGVFFTEDELVELGVAEDLDVMLAEIDRVATPLTDELLVHLEAIAATRRFLAARINDFEAQAARELAAYPEYSGQVRKLAKGESTMSRAQSTFVKDWRDTLQLLRTLCREFDALGARPSWVAEDTHPTVHFDQFLHGYYYSRVLRTSEEDDGGGSVEQLFERNKTAPGRALKEAADWWKGLPRGPSGSNYDEAVFIRERAPRMAVLFSADGLTRMTEDNFVEAMGHVHAFRDHARQVGNDSYNLPDGFKASEDERAVMFAKLVWGRRSESGKTPVDLLQFVVHGEKPIEAEERLWLGCRSKEWRIQGLGPSSLGEVLGWARPDRYPPRNDRTNKALRSLGHDVRIFNPGKSATKK